MSFHVSLPSSPKSGILVALLLSGLLALTKAVVGIASGSLAVLGSALDSFMDMFVSWVNALALRLSDKNHTQKYAYGFGKVQGFAAIFEWMVVFTTGWFLAYEGITNFLSRTTPTITLVEIYTMIFALLGTGIIVWNFLRISKIHNSVLIRADALHYTSDIVMNAGILIALIITKYAWLWWIDAVFAIFIAVWIIKNALPILWSGISMLLDKSLTSEEIRKIESILEEEWSLEWYHYLKTRRSGDDIFIEAHIVFRDKNISLRDAHSVSESLESSLWAHFPWALITLHLDIDWEPEVCEIER